MGFPASPHHLWETQLISGPSLLGLLGLLFFLTLSYLLWALSSQHKVEPWFPSLVLIGFPPYDLSAMPVPGTPARKNRHAGVSLPLPITSSPEPNIYHAPSLPPCLCGVERPEELIKTRACSARPGLMKRWLSFGYPYLPSGGSRGTKTWEPLGEKRWQRWGVQRADVG